MWTLCSIVYDHIFRLLCMITWTGRGLSCRCSWLMAACAAGSARYDKQSNKHRQLIHLRGTYLTSGSTEEYHTTVYCTIPNLFFFFFLSKIEKSKINLLFSYKEQRKKKRPSQSVGPSQDTTSKMPFYRRANLLLSLGTRLKRNFARARTTRE